MDYTPRLDTGQVGKPRLVLGLFGFLPGFPLGSSSPCSSGLVFLFFSSGTSTVFPSSSSSSPRSSSSPSLIRLWHHRTCLSGISTLLFVFRTFDIHLYFTCLLPPPPPTSSSPWLRWAGTCAASWFCTGPASGRGSVLTPSHSPTSWRG